MPSNNYRYSEKELKKFISGIRLSLRDSKDSRYPEAPDRLSEIFGASVFAVEEAASFLENKVPIYPNSELGIKIINLKRGKI